MSRYPFAESDTVPNVGEYRRYLRDYQTREYSPYPFWKSVLRSREF